MSTTILQFDLPLPATFRGLDLRAPIHFYRRHLPHWRQDGATYAVTFRLCDSIPQTKLRELQRLREHWEAECPEPRSEADWQVFAKRFTKLANHYLDQGHGACVLRTPQHSELCSESIRHFDGERYELITYVVMPNHVHLIVRPFPDHTLEDLIGDIKQYVSTRINRNLRQTGALFQAESYDRIIRDAHHLWEGVQYIGANPRKANLPAAAWARWLSPTWRELGWYFKDEREELIRNES